MSSVNFRGQDIFARKMPEFYITIARKIFFPIFFGGEGGARALPASPVSYAYVGRCLPLSGP